MKYFLLVFFLHVCLLNFSQEIQTMMPIDAPWLQSGTFCELRPNHFHTGLDLKSPVSAVGQNLYAIDDGYVVRIKVTGGGYGRCLYIYHPNLDKVSVYAHLLEFSEDIEKLVVDSIYTRKTNEIDIYLDSLLLPLKKGDIVGKMGNSGYSFGPHLHFELRSKNMEVAYNPLAYLPGIDDRLAPVMNALKISNLNWQNQEINSKVYYPNSKGQNKYQIPGIIETSTRVGLAIRADDRQQGTHNLNGIYAVKLYQNDELVYSFTMDSTLFENERQINSHLDYTELKKRRKYYHNLYSNQETDLRIYGKKIEAYFIPPAKASSFRIVVTDYYQNSTELEFKLEADRFFDEEMEIYNYVLHSDQPGQIDFGDWKFNFEEGSFGRDVNVIGDYLVDSSGTDFKQINFLGNDLINLYKPIQISVKGNHIANPETLEKYYVVRESHTGKKSNLAIENRNQGLVTTTWEMGTFYLQRDTIPPKISIVTSKAGRLSKIVIRDDVFGWDQIEYRVSVDDEFIWLMPDNKSRSLQIAEGSSRFKGSKLLKVFATDACGNQTISEKKVNF